MIQICLPYLDPALWQTRTKILQITYGFSCTCPSCRFLSRLEPLPDLPEGTAEVEKLATELRAFVGISPGLESLPQIQWDNIPPSLHCVLREEYMSQVSESFSKASHEGQYVAAIDSGLTLLALYDLAYPQNYPQIGETILSFI